MDQQLEGGSTVQGAHLPRDPVEGVRIADVHAVGPRSFVSQNGVDVRNGVQA